MQPWRQRGPAIPEWASRWLPTRSATWHNAAPRRRGILRSWIEESIAKSNDGEMSVDQAAADVRVITADAAKVKTLVEEVSQGSQEQTRGIEQVAKVIAQMQQVTQQTAANAEESAAASAELHAQSESLRQIVGRLAAMVTGSGTTNGPARPASRQAVAAAKVLAAHR
jgi:uncharacterized phage infection (PIP) family protein YhgE